MPGTVTRLDLHSYYITAGQRIAPLYTLAAARRKLQNVQMNYKYLLVY